MAARKVKIRHDDETRAKIQASQIINRLTDHMLGNCQMEATQVRAAEILLRKSLPDLQSVEMSGPDGGAVNISFNTIYEKRGS
jgi:hypothetical protein